MNQQANRTETSALRNQIPVVDTAGVILGHAPTNGFRKAVSLLGTPAAQQNFRDVNGSRRLCWTGVRGVR